MTRDQLQLPLLQNEARAERITDTPELRLPARQGLAALVALFLLCLGTSSSFCYLLLRSSRYNYMFVWLVFALMAPVTYIGGRLCSFLRGCASQVCFITIGLNNLGGKWDKCLMEALAAELRLKKVWSHNVKATILADDEEEDTNRKWQVTLLPQLSCTRVEIQTEDSAGQRLEVEITLQQKDPMICGRNREPRNNEAADISIRTATYLEFLWCSVNIDARQKIHERQLRSRDIVRAWLQELVNRYTKQKPGCVEVWQLQNECYKDYNSYSWELIRKGPCCQSHQKGQTFYVDQEWARKIKNQIDFTVKSADRASLPIFISGGKGSGKTCFVEWLAGELKTPIYYIDLKSPGISATVLRDAICINKLKHNPPVLFHVDEFQRQLTDWVAGQTVEDKNSGVSIEDLQGVLEGISTPDRAIFIFTSSEKLPSPETCKEMEGLIRRFKIIAQAPYLNKEVAHLFLEGFLAGFVPGLSWSTVCACDDFDNFARAWSYWSEDRRFPFDILRKYTEQAVMKTFQVVSPDPGVELQNFLLNDNILLKELLTASSVLQFLDSYAAGIYSLDRQSSASGSMNTAQSSSVF